VTLHKFIVYDESRQRVFLSATDHVDVFGLEAQAFLQPIEPPPNGPPPSVGLRGLSLTPDHSQLVVADFGSQKVYLVNRMERPTTARPFQWGESQGS